MQYTQDHDERFPQVNSNVMSVATKVPPYTIPYGWADSMYTYTKSTALNQCPSDEGEFVNDSTKAGFTDYGYNNLLGRGAMLGNMPTMTLAAMQFPSQTISLYESGSGSAQTNTSAFQMGVPTGGAGATIAGGKVQRHLDGGNYLYADGHVKWLKAVSDTSSPQVWGRARPFSEIGTNTTFRVTDAQTFS
jgi:prepilin-type processing-associated H-X9-DG protein